MKSISDTYCEAIGKSVIFYLICLSIAVGTSQLIANRILKIDKIKKLIQKII